MSAEKSEYSTQAVACGLSDVAGWLENEGWIPKHVRQIRSGAQRLRELDAENERLREAIQRFHGAYLEKFGRPATGGVRASAPLQTALGELLLVAYEVRSAAPKP